MFTPLFLCTQKTVSNGGIKAGERFGYGKCELGLRYGHSWTDTSQVEFNLNAESNGDSFFLYCFRSNGSINFIFAFSYAGEWKTPGLTQDEYGIAYSSLPDELKGKAAITLTLPHYDSFIALLRTDENGTAVDEKASLLDPNSWQGCSESSVMDRYINTPFLVFVSAVILVILF